MQHLPDSKLPSIIGVDIGGANLKYASATGKAFSSEFPLWSRPDELAAQLADDLAQFHDVDFVAATMTGELADCFLDRKVGVRHIVQHLQQATEATRLPPPQFYSVDGQFYKGDDTPNHIDRIAASNWHSLASLVASEIAPGPERGLVVDIGSTTTDLIPFKDGAVSTASQTDFDRLANHELVYLGGGRTAVCAVVDRLEFDGNVIPVMREVFATLDDVRILLRHQKTDAEDCQSADGKPRDMYHASNRMARMIGLDHRTVTIDDATKLAEQVHHQATALISDSIASFEGLEKVVVSGHADDLLRLPTHLNPQIVSLRSKLGDSLSRCAPAYAVAQLLSKKLTSRNVA